ncbi:hypothetical protein [Chitinophaga silvisoli]|uniref:Uncharacterized protein n=1 Tax=Chitinophaga silvisoli TaxID=2291814 RepID=A0A3E1P023_9BACT|nr:hypothetical protein [Chitinophaga silvisoli]RFM33495.1 hypothetical protein DXN04_16165 [Chitinophaga silvisoli]
MRVFIILLAMAFSVIARAQNSINNYKYVLVPERFDIFKNDDQYGVNTMTKYLLEGVGFKAYMTDEPLPAELANNKCGALKAELVEKKKFLATGLILVLKDCQGTVVYQSQEGKSREKEWQAAYTEALRNAFVSLNAAQYKYDSSTSIANTAAVASTSPAATTPAVVNTTAAAPVISAATPAAVSDSKDILYAQANANGYQLIDTSPKKVMTLLKTSQQDNFIADNGVDKGIVFRKNGEWYFEFYKEDKLNSVKLNIKF